MKVIKIIGYHEFTSKKGNRCYKISVTSSLDQIGKDDVMAGESAETYFLPQNLVGKISKEDVGKTYDAYIAYFNGRSNLVDIIK